MKYLLFTDSNSWKTLRGHFIAGLAVLAPLFITSWVVVTIFNYMDARIRDYFKQLLDLQVPPYGAGVLVTFVGIIFVGMLARNIIGGRIIRFFESLLLRVPVANRLYGALKQIVGAFVGRDKTIFEKVVMIEYPRRECYSLGFLTYPEKIQFGDHYSLPDMICVFLPTTPNPTSGLFLMLPEKDVKFLSMSVEDGLKMIISGGVVLPESVSGQGKPIAFPTLD